MMPADDHSEMIAEMTAQLTEKDGIISALECQVKGLKRHEVELQGELGLIRDRVDELEAKLAKAEADARRPDISPASFPPIPKMQVRFLILTKYPEPRASLAAPSVREKLILALIAPKKT